MNMFARSEVFTAVKIQVDVIPVVMNCGVVVGCHRFGRPYCHPEDRDSKVLRNVILPQRHSMCLCLK